MYFNALDFMLDTVNEFGTFFAEGGKLFIEDFDGDLLILFGDRKEIAIEPFGHDRCPVLFTNVPGVGNFIRIVGGVF